MSVIDRLSQVMRSEWSHRFRRKPKDGAGNDHDDDGDDRDRDHGRAPPAPARKKGVVDVQGALRVLDLTGTPTLAEVRARYAELARRYHPKTQSPKDDEAHAARVVLEALTDALELLEEHLLPLS